MLCGCGSALVFVDLEARHYLVHNGVGVVESEFVNRTSCFYELKANFGEVMFEVVPRFYAWFVRFLARMSYLKIRCLFRMTSVSLNI